MIGSAKPTAATAVAPELAEPARVSAGRRRVCAASLAGAAAQPVDCSPLRVSDPARVGGYRLVARLGAGGMADVFYSMAPNGRPAAVKVFHPCDGGAEACHREYQLARAAGADCTAPALGYGTSPEESYLVMADLPGYRCGTTLTGRPPSPAQWLWRFGAALAGVLTALHVRGQEWLLRVQSAEPDLFGLPPVLEEVVRWCLARNPADRPSAAELTVTCAGAR